MKINSKKIKDEIEKRLKHPDRTFIYDRQKDQLRIESKQTGKGITITLAPIVAKWEQEKENAIDRVVYYVEQGLHAMNDPQSLSGIEKRVFPVIRSTSFPTVTKEGVPLIYDDHTPETRIYYALDGEKSYRLLDEKLIAKEGWNVEQIKEMALFNVRRLPTDYKTDTVAGNTFYFINKNDGYDASRILNESFLKEMEKKITGTMVLAVPHQDVFIIADVQNDTGYDVLAQMTMSFFTEGRVPITILSFLYENGELEPIFILAKNRKK